MQYHTQPVGAPQGTQQNSGVVRGSYTLKLRGWEEILNKVRHCTWGTTDTQTGQKQWMEKSNIDDKPIRQFWESSCTNLKLQCAISVTRSTKLFEVALRSTASENLLTSFTIFKQFKSSINVARKSASCEIHGVHVKNAAKNLSGLKLLI